MPIYEFRCLDCGTKFQTLVGVVAESSEEKCPKCGSDRSAKLVSRIARYRNEDDRLDELADRFDSMSEPGSAVEMRKTVREMGKAMDEDMSDEMEEMFEEDPD